MPTFIMNIFVLHKNQRKAARWHCDKHVVKMILETTQLLYTAHWIHYYPSLLEYKSAVALSKYQKTLSIPEYMKSAPECNKSGDIGYRPCHITHPCAIWTRKTICNYYWLIKLGLELCREFTFRYNKVHKCYNHLIWLQWHYPPNIPHKNLTTFAIAMGNEYKISDDPIICYKHFYNTSKKERGLLTYTGRHIPHWIDITSLNN
jgi:hypothetical protein